MKLTNQHNPYGPMVATDLADITAEPAGRLGQARTSLNIEWYLNTGLGWPEAKYL